MNIFASMTKNRKMKEFMRKSMLFLMIAVIVTTILGGISMSASAAFKDGWGVSYKEPGTVSSNVNTGDSDDVTQQKDVSTIESFAAWLIAAPGYAFDEAIRSTGIDCSVSGIVMGRLASGQSYFQFDLSDDNIYGTIGATLYVGFRAMALTALIILVAVGVIKSLFYSDVKSFSELKQVVIGGVIAVVVMLIMPLAVDWAIKVKDEVALWFYNIAKTFSGASNVGVSVDNKGTVYSAINLASTYRKTYEEHSDLVNAIIYTAVCFLPFTYIINYTKIAITQLVLFGSFPAFCAVGAKDKKAIANWFSVFLTNLFIPAVDMTLLLLPQLIITKMNSGVSALAGTNGTAQYVGWELLKAVVTITAFMFVIPAREQLLKMLGNYMGVPMGGGLFAAGAMAGAAAKGAFDAAKGIAGGIGDLAKKDDGPDGDGPSSEKANADASEDPSTAIGGNGMDEVEDSPGKSEFDNSNDENDNNEDNNEDALENEEDSNEANSEAEEEAQADELSDEEQVADDELEARAAGEDGEEISDDDSEEFGGSDESGDNNLGGDLHEDANSDEIEGSTGADDSELDGADGASPADIDAENGADGAENGRGAGNAADEVVIDTPPAVDVDSDDMKEADSSETVLNGEPDVTDTDVNTVSDDSENGSSIENGHPLDMPSEGSEEPQGADIKDDIENELNDASVSVSDLNGEGVPDLDSGAMNYEELGDEVKENSPADMLDFNMDRAANLASMDSIKDKMGEIDTKNDEISAKAESVKSDMAANNIEIAKTRDEQKEFVDKATDGGKKEMSAVDKAKNEAMNTRVDTLRSQNIDLAQQGAELKQQMSHNNQVKAGLDAELSRRGGIEKQNAQKAAGMTGNSQTFKSAADMVKSLKHDNNMRKMANYKNYNSAEFKGVMTNQQKAEYAKTKRRAEAAGRIASGVAKAGATYATAIATVAAMGGGAETVKSVNSGVKNATSGWADSASSGAEYVASGEALKDAKQTAQNAKTTVINAKDGVLKAGQALRSGDAARAATSGVYRTGRAVQSGAQVVAQKTVGKVKAIPKVPGKVVNTAKNGAVGAYHAGKETVKNSIDGAKAQWKAEGERYKAGPVQGKSKKNDRSEGKSDTKKKTSQKKTDEQKAYEYTAANLNNDDPVNKARNEETARKAKEDVENFNKGK